MGLEEFQGVPVGQAAVFAQDKNDNPVPVGEQHPLPTKKAGQKSTATIAAGQTVSNPVCIAGAEHVAFVIPDAFDGGVIHFQVSDTEDGNYHRLFVNSFEVSLYIGNNANNGANPFGSAVVFNQEVAAFTPWQYVKLVAPVAQTASRAFEIHSK